jgi:hypothetical protein
MLIGENVFTYSSKSECFIYNNKVAGIKASRHSIRINCTVASVYALRELLRIHEEKFKEDSEIVLQNPLDYTSSPS